MEFAPANLWIAVCVARLQAQWRTVDPEVLTQVAWDLWDDPRLRAMEPSLAAVDWLEPEAVPPSLFELSRLESSRAK